MTTNSLAPTATYLEDAATLTHAVPYLFLSNDDLIVERYDPVSNSSVVLTIGADYIVSGAGAANGGAIRKTVARAGCSITITRQTPRIQSMDYAANDTFPAESHERALDRSMLIDQEQDVVLRDLRRRAVLIPASETGPMLLPPSQQRAGRVLAFDGLGRPITLAFGVGSGIDYTALLQELIDKASQAGVLNIMDYGAVGGGADDTAAIIRCAVAADSKRMVVGVPANGRNGQPIEFSIGLVQWETLQGVAGFRGIGGMGRLKALPSAKVCGVRALGKAQGTATGRRNLNGAIFDNVRLNMLGMTDPKAVGVGIDIDGGSNILIEKNEIYGDKFSNQTPDPLFIAGQGIGVSCSLATGENPVGVIIRNNRLDLRPTNAQGVQIDPPSGAELDQGPFLGISVGSASDGQAPPTRFALDGQRVDATYRYRYCLIENNQVNGSYYNINLTASEQITVRGNDVANGARSLSIQGGNQFIRVIDNDFREHYSTALLSNFAQSDLFIYNNRSTSRRCAGNPAFQIALGATRVRVLNNTAVFPFGSGSTPSHMFYLGALIKDCEISGNYGYGNVTKAFIALESSTTTVGNMLNFGYNQPSSAYDNKVSDHSSDNKIINNTLFSTMGARTRPGVLLMQVTDQRGAWELRNTIVAGNRVLNDDHSFYFQTLSDTAGALQLTYYVGNVWLPGTRLGRTSIDSLATVGRRVGNGGDPGLNANDRVTFSRLGAAKNGYRYQVVDAGDAEVYGSNGSWLFAHDRSTASPTSTFTNVAAPTNATRGLGANINTLTKTSSTSDFDAGVRSSETVALIDLPTIEFECRLGSYNVYGFVDDLTKTSGLFATHKFSILQAPDGGIFYFPNGAIGPGGGIFVYPNTSVGVYASDGDIISATINNTSGVVSLYINSDLIATRGGYGILTGPVALGVSTAKGTASFTYFGKAARPSAAASGPVRVIVGGHSRWAWTNTATTAITFRFVLRGISSPSNGGIYRDDPPSSYNISQVLLGSFNIQPNVPSQTLPTFTLPAGSTVWLNMPNEVFGYMEINP